MDPYSSIYANWEKFWGRGGKYTPLGWYITSRKLSHIRHLLNGLDVTSCIDVGCGSGRTLRLLSELTGNAVGLDIAPTAVAGCRARGLRAIHDNLLTHSGSYDLVFSDGLIEHFEDYHPFIAALCRLSRRYIMIVQVDHSIPVIKLLSRIEQWVKHSMNVPEYPHQISSFIEEFGRYSFLPVDRGKLLWGGIKVLLFSKTTT